MTILALDTFQRANSSPNWGTASDVGGSWTNNTSSAISNNQGTYSGVTTVIALFATGATNSADAEVLVRVTTGNTGDLIAAIVRKTAVTTYYYAGLTAANTVAIFKNVTGTTTSLASAAFTWSANTSYWIRFQIQGTNLLLKVWADGTAEPTTWNVTITDASIAGAGGVGVRMKPAATTSDVIAVDHFTADDLTYAFGTDALTSSDSFAPTLVDTLQDALTSSDSFAATLVDLLQDALTSSDSFASTLVDLLQDALTSSDSFASALSNTLQDALSASDSFAATTSMLPVDALISSDNLASALSIALQDALSVQDLLTATLIEAFTDTLSSSDFLLYSFLPITRLIGRVRDGALTGIVR